MSVNTLKHKKQSIIKPSTAKNFVSKRGRTHKMGKRGMIIIIFIRHK